MDKRRVAALRGLTIYGVTKLDNADDAPARVWMVASVVVKEWRDRNGNTRARCWLKPDGFPTIEGHAWKGDGPDLHTSAVLDACTKFQKYLDEEPVTDEEDDTALAHAQQITAAIFAGSQNDRAGTWPRWLGAHGAALEVHEI